MKFSVLDKAGKKVSDLTVDDGVFGIKPNSVLMKQYTRVYLSNQRQGTSSVKDRSEVSGGGKKPWRQKGTGRARAGSSRSPLWVGGGVVHGPSPKDWRLKMPKGLRKLAIKSALSYQIKHINVVVLDKLSIKEPNTKALFNLLDKLKVSRSVLLVTKEVEPMVVKSASNLPNLSVSFSGNLNAYEILRAHNIVFLEEAIKSIEEKYK